MAAMEAGVYKGDDLFQSGTYVTTDGTEIGDHDREGWGNITFDRGFALSSNVGALHLVKDYIDAKTLKDYFLKLGFGQVTGITLPRESAGKIDFRYETEVFNASFGQGIMTTAMQNIKALTSISNDGILLEPYIIDKIVDPTTGEVVYEGKKNELGRVASEQTTNKMKALMRSVVQEGTGTSYKMDGYDIIAKTGTAQIASTDGTGYLKGESDVIRGFAGMYPGDDPKVIIYATLKRPVPNSVAPLSNAIKEIIQNIAKYMDMEPVEQPTEEITSYEVPSYYNQNVTDIVDQLTNMQIASVVIGDGDRIIDQFPSQGTTITSKEKVYLITSGPNKVMPNLMGYSLKEADTLLSYYGISYTFTGSGYVTAQNIPEGTPITDGLVLTVTLAPKYVIEEETSSP